jgi:hypothetical protein
MNENECVYEATLTTLAAWTLITLFSKLLKISKINFFQNNNFFGEGKSIESSLLKFQISKLNNYYTDMC